MIKVNNEYRKDYKWNDIRMLIMECKCYDTENYLQML